MKLILFLVLQLLAPSIYAQSQFIAFEHLTAAQGLSHSNVNCILQDREGFMWFGTKDGLNRYDGHNFQIYAHDPTSKSSISNNTIWALYQDHAGTLWIGTAKGLNKFEPLTQTFIRVELGNNTNLSDVSVSSIYEDRAGILWVGTSIGLNKLDPVTHRVTLLEHNPGQDRWKYNAIQTLYEDRAGTLWVGTNQGLSFLDRKTARFIRYYPVSYFNDISFPNAVKAIYEDEAGILWIGTTGNGLQQFNRKTHIFTAYLPDSTNKTSISNPSVLSICEDDFGALWIATDGGGLNHFDKNSGKFTHYLHDSNKSRSISTNALISIYKDHHKILWIGTYAGGINKIDLLKKKIIHYKHDSSNPNSLLDNYVYALFSDHGENIWISTRNGLTKLDRKTGQYIRYPFNRKYFKNSSIHIAHCIYEDHTENIWLGTGGAGLKKFDPISQRSTSYVHDPNDSTSLSHNYVQAMLEDKQGYIWIGTKDGLCQFDPIKNHFLKYSPTAKQPFEVNGLLEDHMGILWVASRQGLFQFDTKKKVFVVFDCSDNSFQASNYKAAVKCIYEDSIGRIWMGMDANGLYCFNRKAKHFSFISQPKELTKMSISRILGDLKGNLWLTTQKNGIVKFNPYTQTFRQYDAADGLQANEFNQAAAKSIRGDMYFGGNNGFNSFYPDSISDNPYAPQVAIRQFKVFNEPRNFTGKQLILNYNENFFSFDFAALHYVSPDKNRYAYLLEGVDKDWIQAGTRHEASYTNLDPGKYVFKVKAANYDGIWNEQGTFINIIITPPWWRTTWAYGLYALLLIFLLYISRQYTINQERLKAKLKMQNLESEKYQELNQLKHQFFTNVSHEFRTPLTLILNPLEDIIDDQVGEAKKKEYYQLIYKNAKRLQALINQLLDFDKLEAGSLTLSFTPGDIILFIKEKVYSFVPLAEKQLLNLQFCPTKNSLWVYFDPDKVEKILFNLLSNAFKFTPAQGEIIVVVSAKSEISQSAQWVEIQVKDTGIGIPADKIDRIFDRFYQIDNITTHSFEGTGIGLSLVKELVLLHGGNITVSNLKEGGTCFTIELPLVQIQNNELESQWVDQKTDLLKTTWDSYEVNVSMSEQATTQSALLEQQVPLLLIVEDHADIRSYLRNTFESTYRIAEAINGIDGFQLATNMIPDLVISDWMMPHMDGKSFCTQLKNDERTSHIPIILVTAKSAVENKLEGLETGADDYLIKPFHTQELIIRVRNLLTQRKKLRERFSQTFHEPLQDTVSFSAVPASTIPSTDKVFSAIEEQFLQKITSILEANLTEPAFDTSVIEKKMGLSRIQLYRKMKAVTNQTPGEFMRNFRLKKAAVLLSQRQNNISQVAYQVGFTHLSYFTRCFRQVYGMTPSEYAANHSPAFQWRK